MRPPKLPLFPYQAEDAEQLHKRRSAYIAHQQRVGKTPIGIQIANLKKARRVLIVCPAFLAPAWRTAVQIWRTTGWVAVIVSYNRAKDIVGIDMERFDVGIFDESHFLKERSAQRTQACLGPLCDGVGGLISKCDSAFFLSATPQPNHPGELWPILRAAAPNLIMGESGKPLSYTSYVNAYCKVMRTPFGSKISGSKNVAKLREAMKGWMISRTRSSVFGRDLQPPRIIHVEPPKAYATKIEALEKSDEGQAVLRALRSGGLDGLKRLAGGGALRRYTGMAKLPGAVEHITNDLDGGMKKCVIFGWHTDVLDGLAQALKKYGVVVLDGRTPPEKRDPVVQRFQTKVDIRVAICQISATGVGIDLSAADDAYFIEQAWTGADNEQAMARIFNVQSPNPKFTHLITLPGSVDEQIMLAVQRKSRDEKKLLRA